MKLSAVKLVLQKMANPEPGKEVLTQALGLSSIVYFSNNFIEKNLTALKIDFKILEHNDMKCLVAETDQAVFISFRGTEPTKIGNWKRILNIFPRKFGLYNLKVHGGFELYHKEYQRFVQEFIETIDRPKKIIFTGHSLGAALAALFNISYSKLSYCINFACPNLLFNSPYDSISSDSYRILSDFVTWIPFDLPFMNWSKPTKSIRIKSKYKSINPFKYHSLENYIQSILQT